MNNLGSQRPTFLLRCKREHLLFDKDYVVLHQESEILIAENIHVRPKYKIPLNILTTINWRYTARTTPSLDFGFKYRNQVKYFKVQYTDALNLKHFLEKKVMFEYVIQPYDILSQIGQGSTCEVYKIRDWLTGSLNALKIGDKSLIQGNLLSEAQLVKRLNHPNIIQLKEIASSEKSYLIVYELMKGKSLLQLLREGPLPKKQITTVTKVQLIYNPQQLLEALSYLKENGIVHRDIKPENVMFRDEDTSRIVIIDFGYAGRELSRASYIYGTYGYFAPESSQASEADQTCKGDVFSTGCILFEMITGERLFGGNNREEITKANKLGEFSLKHKLIGETERDLLAQMLMRDQTRRISAKDALMHPYFSENLAQEKKHQQMLRPQIPPQSLEFKSPMVPNKNRLSISVDETLDSSRKSISQTEYPTYEKIKL